MEPGAITALTSALAGAIVGGGIGFLGTLARDKLVAREKRKRLVAALVAEVTENRLRFSGFAKEVQKLGRNEPLETLFNRWTGQHFFPVYDNSAHDLGLLDSADTVVVTHAIVSFKNLIEALNMIHESASRFSELRNQFRIVGQDERADEIEREEREVRIRDAERLRPALKQLLDDADRAIEVLQKYAKKNRG